MAIVEKGDGCSAGISKFRRKVIGTPPAWEGCCDKHDEAYNWGGTEADRKEADKALRDCMKRMGHGIRAQLYYMAVRTFGRSHFNYH